MIRQPWFRPALAAVMVVLAAAGSSVLVGAADRAGKTWITAYFDNTNGLFAGDDVRILGVPVGRIEHIEPQPTRAKVTFWVERSRSIPADAKAVILSPQLVTGRAIQLTPAYTGGPVLQTRAVIGQDRTAVPVEWDDVRVQLERLTGLLLPTGPGGLSTLGMAVDTAADNLRGNGRSIRDTITKLAQTVSVLGDHSQDIFATFKNLSTLVSALRDSADVLEQLNGNLASVTGLLADSPDKVGNAIADLNSVVGDVRAFTADNRDAVSTTVDKLASITTALVESLDDIEQTLHIAPGTVANFNNIYEPANGSLTGALAVNNFADPISFLCGAIQAASRMNAEQSAKLCVQYLAPIVKNRQYNFPPLGFNPLVGAQARPNEVTYSEPSLRPDFVPTDPSAGLEGLMTPPGGAA